MAADHPAAVDVHEGGHAAGAVGDVGAAELVVGDDLRERLLPAGEELRPGSRSARRSPQSPAPCARGRRRAPRAATACRGRRRWPRRTAGAACRRPAGGQLAPVGCSDSSGRVLPAWAGRAAGATHPGKAPGSTTAPAAGRRAALQRCGSSGRRQERPGTHLVVLGEGLVGRTQHDVARAQARGQRRRARVDLVHQGRPGGQPVAPLRIGGGAGEPIPIQAGSTFGQLDVLVNGGKAAAPPRAAAGPACRQAQVLAGSQVGVSAALLRDCRCRAR